MKVRFLSEAVDEFEDAVAYYEERRTGLGRDFAAEVRDGIGRMTEYPHAWQVVGRRSSYET